MAKIIIVGAGIGGPATTVAVEQAGFEVCAIEHAPRFGELRGADKSQLARRRALEKPPTAAEKYWIHPNV